MIGFGAPHHLSVLGVVRHLDVAHAARGVAKLVRRKKGYCVGAPFIRTSARGAQECMVAPYLDDAIFDCTVVEYLRRLVTGYAENARSKKTSARM